MKITLSGQAVTVAAADYEGDGKRPRIAGRLVPYNVVAHPKGPYGKVQFAPGSLQIGPDLSRVKLLRGHEADAAIGHLVECTDSSDGMDGVFVLGRSQSATDALQDAQDRVADGLSVGVRVIEATQDPVSKVWTVTAAELQEVSLLAMPAYDDARLSSIAAQRKGNPMPDDITPDNVPAPGAPGVSLADMGEAIRAAVAEQFATFGAANAPALPAVPDAGTVLQARRETNEGLYIDAEGYGRDVPAYVATDGTRITAGDYMGAYLQGRQSQDPTAFRRIQAAIAHNKTTDVPGLLPTPILGPLLGDVEYIRRVWNSGSLRVMPAKGKGFQRPKITQHVAVDKQAAEKTDVASQPMKVTLDDVVKETIAGALNLSVQAIDWTEPALLDLVIRDFARIYAAYSDTYAATSLTAGATGTPIADVDFTKPAEVNAALYKAAAAVWTIDDATDPNTLWMSVDVWATLGAMVDTTGRPLFPFLSPTNALGTSQASNPDNTNIQGWRPVVSPKLPAGTLIVGDSRKFELYEDRRGMLRAEEPSILGVQIAWYGYVASYIADGKAFVPITAKTPVPPAGTASK